MIINLICSYVFSHCSHITIIWLYCLYVNLSDDVWNTRKISLNCWSLDFTYFIYNIIYIFFSIFCYFSVCVLWLCWVVISQKPKNITGKWIYNCYFSSSVINVLYTRLIAFSRSSRTHPNLVSQAQEIENFCEDCKFRPPL